MSASIELGIQTESITGYYVYIQYKDGVVYESRCGVGRGCFPVHEEPYDATPDEWEAIVEKNREYIERMTYKHPGSRFSFSTEERL